MKFDEGILREADIRGQYPDQINGEFANRLGKVFGTYLQSIGRKYCVVGHDNRFGGPQLTKELIAGIDSTGINTIYVGLCTTAMFNFAARRLKTEYGIMVTASHNPKNDNGFKLFGKNYQHCDHDVLAIIYSMLKDPSTKLALGDGVVDSVNIEDAYAKAVAEMFDFTKKDKKKIVVDCGNGTASMIVRKVYDRLPFDVVYINSDSNPNFPNHHPDPNVKNNLVQLQQAVKKNRAFLGIAYDGDCDRAGFVDEKGNVVEADLIIAIMCKDIIKNSENKIIMTDVKCSKVCEDEIVKNGGVMMQTTPSSATQERLMEKHNVMFGGQYANHFFFRDKHPGYDDGIYCGLRVQEMLRNRNKSLYELVSELNLYVNTGEIKVATTDDKKWKIVDLVKEYCDKNHYEYITTDGLRITIRDGWALVRCSNTGPNLTLRFEATTEDSLEKIKEEFTSLIDSIK